MSIRKAKKAWKKWMLSQGFIIKYCQPCGLGDDFGFLYSDKDVITKFTTTLESLAV